MEKSRDGEAPWVEVLHGDWPGPLRLRVRGRSMCPTLRPGDQVTVEPVAVDALRPGDWVLLQGREGLFLHRFLGFTREGFLLTKGDAHRSADPPWPPEALLGRAVALFRQGQTIPVSSSSLRERARTTLHRLMAGTWALLRRVGLPLLLLVLSLVEGLVLSLVEGLVLSPVEGLALVPAVAWAAGVSKSWGSERRLSNEVYRNQASGSPDNPLGLDTSLRSYSAGAGPGLFSTLPQVLHAPWAAVTLVSFEATPEGQAIRITWETASEVDMLGFFVQRTPYVPQGEADCQYISGLTRISDLIRAEGDIIGAFYEHPDADVEVGQTYYYCLEAVEVSGATELHGPISATLPLPATKIPTPTPSPTPSHSHTPTPTPTATPTPTPTPDATATRTPTSAPSPTRTPTPAPSPTRTPAPTHSPLTATSPAASTSPTPTATPTQSSPPTLTPTPPLTYTPTATPSPTPPHPHTRPHSPTPTRPHSPSPLRSPSPLLPLSSSLPLPSPTRLPARGEPSQSLPWALILAMTGVGSGLILLGGWGLWRTRGKQ